VELDGLQEQAPPAADVVGRLAVELVESIDDVTPDGVEPLALGPRQGREEAELVVGVILESARRLGERYTVHRGSWWAWATAGRP
jgi:hypothetical protein